jgi:TonB family protein
VILAGSLSYAYGELVGSLSILRPDEASLIFHLDGRSRNSKKHRRPCLNTFTSLLAFVLTLGSPLALQAQSEDHPYRRVTHSQKPVYPDVLKLLSIGGTVRLKIKVLANGTVASAEILGGNPILAESAIKAALAWKYAPAPSTTTEIATFDFNGH